MPLSPPQVTFIDDYYCFNWHDLGVQAVLERFNERKDDIACELTVELDHPLSGGRLYSGRLLLIGPNSRRDVERSLNARFDEHDWGGILEQICLMARERFRKGEPIVSLEGVEYSGRSRFAVEPLVLDRAVTILYGDGDSAKSIIALLSCFCIATGQPNAGLKPQIRGACLYLDWEDDAETHAERLAAICNEMGVAIPKNVYYQRRSGPLASTVREIRRQIAEQQIAFVVVDSLGMAAGDPMDHGLMLDAMRACRALDVPVLVIHHLPKDAKDKSKPFGTVYSSNEARATWLVERGEEESPPGELVVMLTNHKHNRGARMGRLAFKMLFATDASDGWLYGVSIEPTPIDQVALFKDKMTQRYMIADLIKRSGALNVQAIGQQLRAEGRKIGDPTIRTVLNRFDGKGFVSLPMGLWGNQEQRMEEGITVI